MFRRRRGHKTPTVVTPKDDVPPIPCATLGHLLWTLDFDWTQISGGSPLATGWVERATGWRDDRPGSEAWATALADVPDVVSWKALVQAHRDAGLDPAFRTADAYCRQRRYGIRPGLEDRFSRKLDRDVVDDVTPLAKAIRGFLDIVHVHPFNDGNARAACTWFAWCLVSNGVDVPDLGAIVRLPMVVAHDDVPQLIVTTTT